MNDHNKAAGRYDSAIIRHNNSLVNCPSCIYREIFDGYIGCGYVFATDKIRRCPPDKGCTEYCDGEPVSWMRSYAARRGV